MKVEKTSRSSAYQHMTYLAQNLSNEIVYSEELEKENERLNKCLNDAKEKHKELETQIDKMWAQLGKVKDDADAFRDRIAQILLEGEPTDIGCKVTVERIHDLMIGGPDED